MSLQVFRRTKEYYFSESVPNFCIEKKYVLNVIFNEFLGIDYVFERLENFDKIELWLPNNACITLASSWWDTIEELYFQKITAWFYRLCSNDYMSEDDIPLLFGSGITRSSGSKIYCDIDVFATCFLMLSRFEEVVIEERDRYDRFSGGKFNGIANLVSSIDL